MIRVPVIDAKQAALWDERARADSGIPSRVLMEAAGRGVAAIAAREFGPRLSDGVVVAAGAGNNGGDGWVVARALLAAGVSVSVAEVHKTRSPDCEANRDLALADGVRLLADGDDWPTAGVVVDALLGTGASGEPRGEIGALAQRVARVAGAVVAVDGPTGLDLSTGEAHGPVHADVTVTFGGIRRGHLLARSTEQEISWCGRVVVLDIGFPPADPAWPEFVDDRWAAAVLPAFAPGMHKGNRGRVLILGGERGMAGAVNYAARAALAAGAGLVRVAAHPESVAALQAELPDVTAAETALGPDIEPRLVEMVEWADAVALGPGLGRGVDRSAFVQRLLEMLAVPVVLDADALHAGRDALGAGKGPRVMTPHLGEFRAAFPELGDLAKEDRFDAVSRAVADSALTTAAPFTLLLKGVPTVVADNAGHTAVVASGNPALATGGSGDLLSGFVGAFPTGGCPGGAGARQSRRVGVRRIHGEVHEAF
jgi:NAD(P)H-hydrate epimerase